MNSLTFNTPTYKSYQVEYIFNNAKFGFSNSVTVLAISSIDAETKAIAEVSACYGSKMLKRFSFKKPIVKSL